VPIRVRVGRADRTRVDLTGATMWLTLKTDPDTQGDVLAALQINNVDHPTQFSVESPATRGVFTVTMSHTQTAALSAGLQYRVDVKVKDAAGSIYFPVPNQVLQFDQWVTQATSE